MAFVRRIAAIGIAFLSLTSVSQAQLEIDLSVDVTEADGIYTYVYTLTNSDFSFQGINTFLLTTGDLADVTDIFGPDNWFAEYEKEQTLGEQAAFITGLSENGIRCGITDEFDVNPGDTATFTIISPWGPEDQNYSIGRTISTRTEACIFEGDILGGEIASPSVPDVSPFAACDFDQDGDCDVRDIDRLALSVSFGDNDQAFDLNKDALVDTADLDLFLTQVDRLNGDADLNGAVEFADFLTLSGNFGEELNWSDGDFDADGLVAFGDFLILSSNFGKSTAVATLATVPEPSSSCICLLAVLCVTLIRPRRWYPS